MIDKVNDCEYSFMIADLMVMLSGLDKYVVKIWVGSELAFKYSDEWDILFIQEGMKFKRDNRVSYIPYDIIVNIQVFIDEDVRDVI